MIHCAQAVPGDLTPLHLLFLGLFTDALCFCQSFLWLHSSETTCHVCISIGERAVQHTRVKHHTLDIHFERAAIVTLNKHMPAPSKVLWRENKTDKQEAILLNTMLNLITRQT